MLGGVLVMGGLGVVIGVGLALASKIFYVYIDPQIEAIEEALPGANCGGCGLPGCSSNAEAIVAGKSSPSSCVAGGPEVTIEISGIMGVAIEIKEPEIATPGCFYGVQDADLKYIYQGINDCRAAALLSGGTKVCTVGCLGLGTCVKACPFDALSMGTDNLPVVNSDLCTGCGTCERVCPKHIITLSSATLRIIDEYVVDECTAPCQRDCPTGINIRGFIKEISQGNYKDALLIIKEKCPLPLVCGHICPAPCELACRRNLLDEPVGINPLKRFVAEYEMKTGRHIIPYKSEDNGRKVALIGGGAEGLTVGYYLARLGYQPTIFEAKPELGGILRYVIAEDRLPRKVLDHEIKSVLEMGVKTKTKTVMGRDFTVGSLLKDGFNAVMLTTGGIDSRKILRPDQKRFMLPFKGMFIMLDFISAHSRGEKIEVGKEVVIVNGGQTALELARKCRELGAEKILVITELPIDDLPVEFSETKGLLMDGIEVLPSTTITSIGGVFDQLTSVTLETKFSGGVLSEEGRTVNLDSLIVQTARLPELIFIPVADENSQGADGGRWQTLEAFRTYPERNGSGIFSPPEAGRLSDSSAVVKSILSGRRLTRAINQYFSEDAIVPIKNLAAEADHIQNITEVGGVEYSERKRPSMLDVEGDSKTAWIFPDKLPGLDEQAVRQEAERCLQCGLICYKNQK